MRLTILFAMFLTMGLKITHGQSIAWETSIPRANGNAVITGVGYYDHMVFAVGTRVSGGRYKIKSACENHFYQRPFNRTVLLQSHLPVFVSAFALYFTRANGR